MENKDYKKDKTRASLIFLNRDGDGSPFDLLWTGNEGSIQHDYSGENIYFPPGRTYINVTEVHEVPIDSIDTTQTVYNRPIRPGNIRKLVASMKKDGFHQSQVIELNHKRQLIDGQHRVISARTAGIQKVPVIILRFISVNAEAEYCDQRNSLQASQNSKDKWLCKKWSGDPLADFMYKLNSDEDSALYRCVDLYKAGVRLKGSHKISASAAAHAINLAVNDTNLAYKEEMRNKINVGILRKDYAAAKKEVDTLFNLFFDCFGSRSNKVAYHDSVFRSFLSFVKQTKKAGVYYSKYSNIMNKMKTFDTNAVLKQLEQDEIVRRMVNHYNSGKTHGRI